MKTKLKEKNEKLVKLRRNKLSLIFGDYNFIEVTDSVIIYTRKYFDETVLVIFNKNSQKQIIKIENMNRKINLQLFAAGDVVNKTTSASTDNNLSAEMKTFYDKTLITLASPNLVHAQFGQKRPIPKKGGKTIEFRAE